MLMKSRWTRLVIVLTATVGAVVLFGALGAPVFGKDPATVGLTISPPSYELSANPGDVLNDAIRITNDSPDPITFEMSAEDFKVEGTEGSVAVAPEDTANAFSKWFKFPVTQFKLNPKESTTAAYRVEVPKNAEPGGHFASVLFKPTITSSPTNTGAKVVQRVGSLILMTVSGAVVESGKVEKLSAKSFVGSWDEVTGTDGKTKILVAKDEKLGDEKQAWWFDHGPIALDLLVKNEGNVHFKPAGTVTIYNLFGQKVAQLNIDPRNVFPGGLRRTTVIWPAKTLWGGYYRAQVAAVYGSEHKVLTAETVFWAFPKAILIIAIIVLILLILLRRRLIVALSVLIKGR